jgi:glyoxylase-like metal-dependent hydrolase (beta-lactamase superfamily II)
MAAALSLLLGAAPAAAEPAELRLYALDCGRIDIADMNVFADTGEYAGRRMVLADPCFLVRHPKGDLLWDAGIGDRVVAMPDGLALLPGFVATVPVTLQAQLRTLGLDYDRIQYFALSHMHVDHLGNANALKNATWILNTHELDWVQSRGGHDAELISQWRSVRTTLIDSDFDVFGDGAVTILQTPGHTPGHQVLQLKFADASVVILSGDLWHSRENYENTRVPSFNTSRAETLASIDRVTRILKRTHGRLVIQHALEDFVALRACAAPKGCTGPELRLQP